MDEGPQKVLEEYRWHEGQRAEQGVPPQPLNASQCAAVTRLLGDATGAEAKDLLGLLGGRVPAGVDEAAYVKAAFLSALAKGEQSCAVLGAAAAVRMLGTMRGGYNVSTLVQLLEDGELGGAAADELSHTLLMFDAFHDVVEKARAGNSGAQRVLESWAAAEWFLACPEVPALLAVTAFVVPGETNTDDLSPAQEAWSRPDIPLHAQAMLQHPREGLDRPLEQLAELKKKGYPLAYVGDVVGTGSSRKSATNSLLWHIGEDLPHIPNKRGGGVCLAGQIAPIFFNTLEDAGALPIECDVSRITMGQLLHIHPHEQKISDHEGRELCRFQLHPDLLLDELRAGGRIKLIVGRGLSDRAAAELGRPPPAVFRRPASAAKHGAGFTLAQKMVGRACGVAGVAPGVYCEPVISTVGSQDTTGPMTRDELKELACLGFSADLVMQSFCHTAAYPKPVDIETQHQLPDFIRTRGGVSLRPGDGIIHSWLNRMLLPDQVGTGGDSHTRFPLGISFPAGSGMVAFAAAFGIMPLDMPESVLVRFSGQQQPGITLRDLVHAIPHAALQAGQLSLAKKSKKNIFSGRILEIEGLPNLKLEQAFELSDASAERSAGGCTIRLHKAPIEEYLRSNISLLRWLIAESYGDARTLERRAAAMEAWLADPQLLEADANARYAYRLDIPLAQIREPLLACPNDPDDIKTLSAVAGTPVDEVFIGSCMTNIGHFRAAGRVLEHAGEALPTRLWVCPPTRMDQHQLNEEGYYAIFGRVGARTEVPGCSLCMGNQARVLEGATVVSTSTRNFPNRMGKNAKVFLASAEVSAVTAILGRIPNIEEYRHYVRAIENDSENIYRYMNFNEIASFQRATNQPLPVTNIVSAAP